MTYATLALLAVAAAAAVTTTAVVVETRRGRSAAGLLVPTAWTALVLVALTVVADSLMVGADLYRYAPEELLGPHVWLAPIEDLAWPLVAALLLPSLRTLLDPSSGAAPTRADAPTGARG
ncbi:lycopene cyclase [Cellulomonas composti]|uniref:Lycopene cyclase domain-containing protein n=1 Tax=Cellulomonas composti TaxID=266130 RepID=A0A511J6V5_9CELL|nr:lycopene cyclase [Cellulomonas composti]GEL93721.1 hypothetical protein CCO02nite_03790 [Cellulomonas composti]